MHERAQAPAAAEGEAARGLPTAGRRQWGKDRLGAAIIAILCMSVTGAWAALLLWGAAWLILR